MTEAQICTTTRPSLIQTGASWWYRLPGGEKPVSEHENPSKFEIHGPGSGQAGEGSKAARGRPATDPDSFGWVWGGFRGGSEAGQGRVGAGQGRLWAGRGECYKSI